MLVVVDTDIVNYFLKNEPIWNNYEQKLLSIGAPNLFNWVLSFATVQELFVWAIQDKKYDTIITQFVMNCRLAPVTLSLCKTAAKIRASLNRKNTNWHDVWIAATAVDNNLNLVTNNVSHFTNLPKGFKLNLITL